MKLPTLTDREKAYFDTIKQVTRSPRPEHLQLRRMELDGEPVAVVGQLLLERGSGQVAGFHPLAMILDNDTSERLKTHRGEGSVVRKPEDLEGAA